MGRLDSCPAKGGSLSLVIIFQLYKELKKKIYKMRVNCCLRPISPILTGDGGGPFHCPGPVVAGGGWTVGPCAGKHTDRLGVEIPQLKYQSSL